MANERQIITSAAAVPACRCLHLRVKSDFFALEIGRCSGDSCCSPAEPTDTLTGDTAPRFYCLHTMTVLGPDADIVDPHVCARERGCYESNGF
jgi:hypothetical protein